MVVLPDMLACNSGDQPKLVDVVVLIRFQEIPLYIRNKNELISHGDNRGREIVIDLIEYALAHADPYKAALDLVHLDGDILSVGDLRFDLSKRGKIYVLGAGKATFGPVKALEEILKERISDGVIVVKEGQEGKLERVKVRQASHPVPDERGFAAAQEIKSLADKAHSGDIVFCVVTGGSSALAPLPIAGITIAEKIRINELLLYSGATIQEINAVRKHLSDIKGGNLALSIFPAEIINLTVSDVIGDPLDYITDWTVPDTSTFTNANQVLQKYGLLERIPQSAREYLLKADPEKETPKDFSNRPIHTFVLVDSSEACEAVDRRAKELGFDSRILTAALDGESPEVSRLFIDMAKEFRYFPKPFIAPHVVIAGGETTVTIHGAFGKGGPNQELALSTAIQLGNGGAVIFAAIDTDGTDGPTEIAGGIIDNSTSERAREKGLDLMENLSSHNASAVLRELGDAITTGHTGTNVNDLVVMLVR
ncbi:glycerate kinase [Chloroflexota bacterium]